MAALGPCIIASHRPEKKPVMPFQTDLIPSIKLENQPVNVPQTAFAVMTIPSHKPEKNAVIPPQISFTPSINEPNQFWRTSHTDIAVAMMPSHKPEKKPTTAPHICFIWSTRVRIKASMLFHALTADVLITFHRLLKKPVIELHIRLTAPTSLVITALRPLTNFIQMATTELTKAITPPFILFQTTAKTLMMDANMFLIPSTYVENILTMPCHKVLKIVNTDSQMRMKSPLTASQMPRKAFATVFRLARIFCQICEKISLTDSHSLTKKFPSPCHISFSPLNIFFMVLTIFENIPVTIFQAAIKTALTTFTIPPIIFPMAAITDLINS